MYKKISIFFLDILQRGVVLVIIAVCRKFYLMSNAKVIIWGNFLLVYCMIDTSCPYYFLDFMQIDGSQKNSLPFLPSEVPSSSFYSYFI